MKEKVSVTGVPETMIQTLYARAKESEKDNPMIRDDMAAEIVSKLDYDFSDADKDKAMSYGVIARTIVLDEMVERYLTKSKDRCDKYCQWYGHKMLPDERKVFALVQCGFAGNNGDKRKVSCGKRTNLSDCKVSDGRILHG